MNRTLSRLGKRYQATGVNDTPLRETASNTRNLGKDTDAVNCVDTSRSALSSFERKAPR